MTQSTKNLVKDQHLRFRHGGVMDGGQRLWLVDSSVLFSLGPVFITEHR